MQLFSVISSPLHGVDSGIVYETSRVLIPKVQIENRPPPPEEVDVLGFEEASNKVWKRYVPELIIQIIQFK